METEGKCRGLRKEEQQIEGRLVQAFRQAGLFKTTSTRPWYSRPLLLCWLLLGTLHAQGERPKVEVPYQQDVLTITADTIESETGKELVATGSVVATYTDSRLTADRLVYNPDESRVFVEGNIELTRGASWLRGSRAEIDVESNTGVIFDAWGFTDEELFVRAKKVTKTGRTTYVAEDGFLTACEDAVPKWSFRVDKADIDTENSAKLKHTLFRVKKVPLLYFPYMILPAGKKERSSGLLLPTVGNSTTRGTQFSQRVYIVLGRSADILVQEDYFSKRGLRHGVTFRTRPNAATKLDLSGSFIDDKLGRGGGSLIGVGETRFSNGFRGVADFSLVTSFIYRQSFTDDFITATRPSDFSRLFFTNNFQNSSFNLRFSREETLFPSKNVVIRTTPSIDFRVIGKRIPGTFLFFDMDTSLGGLGRTDGSIETPRVSQRLDFFPRLYFSIPLFQGLKLTPRLGLRETFYSDSISELDDERVITGESLRREYVHLTLDLRGWGLSRVYGNEDGGRWKHLIEPQVRYRFLSGIDQFDRIIRFDSIDAVADTNELEYALVNRFFVKNRRGTGSREWLSVKIGQKYFFDPEFGGAIRKDTINQFFPLNTLTGLPYATLGRDLSPVTTMVRLTPDARFSFDIRSDFDTQLGKFRTFSLTGFFRRRLFWLTTTYFVSQDILEGLGQNNQLQGRVGIGNVGRGWSIYGGFSYDAQATRMLSQLARASYYWSCCGVSAEYYGFNIGVREERQVRFSFYLKGIGSFGNIRRPDNVF